MEQSTASPPSTAWKELDVDTTNMDPLSAALPRISVSPSSRSKTAKMTASTLEKLEKKESHMINVNGKLLDPRNYFGEHARKEFFNNYQEMNKNRLMYSGHERSIEISMESKGTQKLSLSRSLPALSDRSSAFPSSKDDQSRNIWGDNDAFSTYDEEKLRKSTKNFYGHYANTSTKVSTSSLSKSLSTLLLQKSDGAGDATATADFSPRTRYIGACIRDNITPLPKLVLRKDEKTTAMNLSHFGVHDKSKLL